MMTQETADQLRAKERELWAKVEASDKANREATSAWCAANDVWKAAVRELAIEREVQKRLAEQAGKLSEATLSAANIGAALAGGARTLEECK